MLYFYRFASNCFFLNFVFLKMKKIYCFLENVLLSSTIDSVLDRFHFEPAAQSIQHRKKKIDNFVFYLFWQANERNSHVCSTIECDASLRVELYFVLYKNSENRTKGKKTNSTAYFRLQQIDFKINQSIQKSYMIYRTSIEVSLRAKRQCDVVPQHLVDKLYYSNHHHYR